MWTSPAAPKVETASIEWKFGAHGGAVGLKALEDALPTGAVIHGGFAHIVTAPVGGATSTVSFGVLSAADVLPATPIADLPINAVLPIVPAPGDVKTWFSTIAADALNITVGGEALTAGRIFVHLHYTRSSPAAAIVPTAVGASGGIAKFTWDFDVHGGDVGDIVLSGYLPDNAIVMDGIIEEVTNVTSGGSATLALAVEASEDVLAATAVAGIVALLDVVPVGTATTMIKVDGLGRVTLTVAVAALIAGKFSVYLRYTQGE